MKRLALASALTVAAALTLGCSSAGQTMNHPFKKKPGASAAAKAPADANYFEMKKDGRTYVFSKIDSMNAFRAGQSPGRTRSEQLEGKTVVFEDRGYTDYNRLVSEYKKAHNIQ